MTQDTKKRAGHNQGSTYQRKDGRWVAVVTIGYTPDGNQARKYFYRKTEAEAKQALRRALATLDKGGVFGNDSITLARFLDQWLETSVKPTKSRGTYNAYRSAIEVHLKPGLGRHRLMKLTPAQVRAFLRGKVDAGSSPAKVRYMRSVLASALNEAMRDELVVRNVAALALPPKAEKFEAFPFSVEEADRFLEAARGDRHEALNLLALTLGLRFGEARGLRWGDVDLSSEILHIRNQVAKRGAGYEFVPLKTQKSRRSLPLTTEHVTVLRAQRGQQLEARMLAGDRWQDLGLVFPSTVGTPLDSREVGKKFHRLLDGAGIPDRRFHDLRHSCASFLAARGVPEKTVQVILGHSTVNTTLNTYVHVDMDTMRAAIGQLGDLIRPDSLAPAAV